MFPAEHLAVSPAIHARVRMPGSPGSERTIELPRDAPSDWLIRAYLLSLGVERGAGVEDRGDRPLRWIQPWTEQVELLEVPELPEPVEVTTSYARTPELGEQQVCVLDVPDDPVDPAGRLSPWWEVPPPFRSDDVNRELRIEFGLVLPRSRDLWDDGYYGQSPIDALLSRLTAVRRLALKAHLARLRSDTAAVDLTEVTGGIRALLDRIGSEGVLQDPVTGWVSWGTLQRAAQTAGWAPTSAAATLPQPEDALFAFARRMRLFRRLRGEVVLTNRGHDLLREPERYRRELDSALREACNEQPWCSLTQDVVLTLLAIADGTVDTADEVPGALARSREALRLDAEPAFVSGMRAGDAPWFGEEPNSERSVGGDLPDDVKGLLGAVAALSPAGSYGSFSPSLRALTLALID